jgi:hypothetical protein
MDSVGVLGISPCGNMRTEGHQPMHGVYIPNGSQLPHWQPMSWSWIGYLESFWQTIDYT